MKITVQDYRRTQTKHRKVKKGHGWTKLERIEIDCIWVNLKNVGPPFLNLCQFKNNTQIAVINITFPYLVLAFVLKFNCNFGSRYF